MDKSTPIGVVAGFLLIFATIFMGQGWDVFFSISSFFIVLGGTVAALLVTFSIAQVRLVPMAIRDFLTYRRADLRSLVEQFAHLSRVARRDGLLALDRELENVEDKLMRNGLEMAVDGLEEDEISEIMRTQVGSELDEQRFGIRFMTSAGAYAPAFGMIGTLIGLIQMLQNLSDPAQIGAGMAVALLTTFYGSLMANLLFLPMAAKMKDQLGQSARARQLVMVGVLSIVKGESPSMVEKKLSLYLPEAELLPSVEAPEVAVSRAA